MTSKSVYNTPSAAAEAGRNMGGRGERTVTVNTVADERKM
jgi:hypothetical protein